MNKIERILYLIVGCIMPIFIGGLHLVTHFSQLVTPEIKAFLQKEFLILGKSQGLWNTWGIVNFMMGASFIIIGLLNISILVKSPKSEALSLLAISAMILYQIAVIYVGYEFEQGFQFYGGIFGLMLILLCFFLTIKSKN